MFAQAAGALVSDLVWKQPKAQGGDTTWSKHRGYTIPALTECDSFQRLQEMGSKMGGGWP